MNYKKIYKAEKGKFYDFKHYDELINNTQYGLDENGDILFCFIKNAIKQPNKEVLKILYDKSKSITVNRGYASGIANIKNFKKCAETLHHPKSLKELKDGEHKLVSVKYKSKLTGEISSRCYSNIAKSSAIGFYDKSVKLECRKVEWSQKNIEKQNLILPLINEISNVYKDNAFEYWEKQKNQSELSPSYILGDSVFSTLTLNHNFRTGCHQDKGDYKDGLSTLLILENSDYKGFYLGLPEYKICFDIRNCDLLIFNAHEYHCNTEPIKMNQEIDRVSIISYLHDKLYKCPYEYTDYKIVIPSFNRPKIIKEKTLSYLKRQKIANRNIYIFLNDEEQKDLYKLPKSYNVIIDGATNIMERRNNIINYFEEGEKLVCIDDDIQYIMDINLKETNLIELINKMFYQLKHNNIGLAGIYPVGSMLYMKTKITFDLRYIIGAFCCLINDKCAIRSVGTLEDFELTIKYYKKYGGLVKFWGYSPKTIYYNSKGGITNGDKETRKILTDIEADIMIEKYGDYITKKFIHVNSGNYNLKLKRLKNKNNIENINIHNII